MSYPRPVRYWHGGVPGLRPGDAILPPSESATTRRLVNSARHSIPDDIARDDVVYLATNREVAKGMRRTTRTERSMKSSQTPRSSLTLTAGWTGCPGVAHARPCSASWTR